MKTEKLYDSWAPIYDLAHHLQTLWADNKHRRYAVEHAKIQPEDKILDIGAGTGLTAKMVAESHPFTSITAIDISIGMLEEARLNTFNSYIDLVNANVEQMPFSDNTFDAIISAYGFGGIENPKKAMEEIVRVAKPNSRISFTEMTEPPNTYSIKKFIHNRFVEPWIKFFWHFRDLDYEKLFREHGIEVDYKEFLSDRIFGSTIVITGYVSK